VTDLLFYAGAFVVALGLLIVVHEFGHFWVARSLGIKVLRFSIGFGRALWSRRVGRDQTELVVAWLPLGGYVKMLDENEGEVPEADKPRAFNRQPVWKRMCVVVAGPAFNFLFAILAYWLVFVAGTEGIKPVVGKVVPDSIAERAGIQAGDTILSFDGKIVQAWNERRLYLFMRALEQQPVNVEVRTPGGEIATRVLDLGDFPVSEVNASLVERGIGLYGYLPEPLPVIGAIDPGPAQRAGLQVDDRIVAIDGEPVREWEALATYVRAHPGEPLTLTVDRAGERLKLTVTPDAVDEEGKTVGRLYIRPRLPELPEEMRVRVTHGVIESLGEGVSQTWMMSWLTLEMLYRMLKFEVSTRNISGPITIAQYAGQSARIGLQPFVLFLAVISVSLAVLNLLPIPVLDGGHLLYYVIEAVTGRPLPERVLAVGQQIGIAVLAGLMFLAFYNDLTRIFSP
jgi:regulator of sigma E protease